MEKISYQSTQGRETLPAVIEARVAYLNSFQESFSPMATLHYWDNGRSILRSIDELLNKGRIDPATYSNYLNTNWTDHWKKTGTLFTIFGYSSHTDKSITQRVHVFPTAFDLSEIGFKCALLDHEKTHVDDTHNGIKIPSGGHIDSTTKLDDGLHKSVRETRAYLNELEGLMREGCTNEFDIRIAIRGVYHFLSEMTRYLPSEEFEVRVKKDFTKDAKSRIEVIEQRLDPKLYLEDKSPIPQPF